MDIETKMELVKKPPCEEVVTEQALREIFETHTHPKHYIGFEISGMVHLGTGLVSAIKINDFLKAGCRPTIWLADYHSWINGKLGGDLENIRKIGEGYFKHCFIALGLPEDKINYLLASKHYHKDFWADVLRISKDTSLKRMLRCTTIMGRKQSDSLSSAAIVYPPMQAADIFLLDVQLAHAGMDQRNVHMLAREVAPKFNKNFIAVHQHLLPGLKGGARMDPLEAKMSKSKPDSAIFVHDSEEEIRKKITKAFCPEKQTQGNPIFEIAQYLILRDKAIKIERPKKFGGDLEIETAESLAKIYTEGKLHPMDLKNTVSQELIQILKPVRTYFAKHMVYLEQIQSAGITR